MFWSWMKNYLKNLHVRKFCLIFKVILKLLCNLSGFNITILCGWEWGHGKKKKPMIIQKIKWFSLIKSITMYNHEHDKFYIIQKYFRCWSSSYSHDSIRMGLGFWCLMPLSTIFHCRPSASHWQTLSHHNYVRIDSSHAVSDHLDMFPAWFTTKNIYNYTCCRLWYMSAHYRGLSLSWLYGRCFLLQSW
jgi:hypothetical protein